MRRRLLGATTSVVLVGLAVLADPVDHVLRAHDRIVVGLRAARLLPDGRRHAVPAWVLTR